MIVEKGGTLPVECVPYGAPHRTGVLELYARIFGPQGARRFETRWRWFQEEGLFPDQVACWVLLEAGQRVVGFLTTVPLPYRIAGQQVVAHSTADFMVAPEVRFHGLKLMRAFARQCAHSISLDDVPETLAVLQWLKVRPVGELRRWVKVLDARLLRTLRPWARRVPGALLWPSRPVLAVLDGVRLPRTSFRVEEVEGFDARFDAFHAAAAETVQATLERDRRYLSWRYGPGSPHRARKVGVVRDAQGALLGYVVTCLETDLGRTGHVLELHTLPGQPHAVTEALLQAAVAQLRRAGAWSVRTLSELQGRNAALLERHGFAARPSTFQLMVKLGDPALAAAAASPEEWSFSYGDAEASYALAGA